MTTIYDIAREAGVSTATVSRALRGRPEVQPEVREKVLKIARRLGYRPNRLARALSSGRTNMFGVVLPYGSGNPFYTHLLDALTRVTRSHGFEAVVLLVELHEEDSVTRAAQYFEEHQVDGLLLFATPPFLRHYLRSRHPDSPPMVALGAAPDFQGPNVRADEDRAGQMLTRHLLDLGHRDIVFVGPPQASATGARQAGYAFAMQKAGLTPRFAEAYPSPEAARKVALDLLAHKDRPTALIAFNDYMAMGLQRAAGEARLQVPGDLSIAGFDNLASSAFYCPPLTTVDLKTEEIAARAVEVLLQNLQVSQPASPPASEAENSKVVTLEPELVVRNSTGPAPATSAPHPAS